METPESSDEHPRRAHELAAQVSSLAEDAWHRLDFRRRLVLLGVALRQGARRARGSAAPVLMASVAAGLAYAFAHLVLDHPTPFFAPISAWICLGFTYNRVPRKVLEMGVGAALGVGLGEVILAGFGSGAWQLAVGLIVGALVGRLLDRGDLFTMQAGVNAMVVIGMGQTAVAANAGGPSRLLDCVVGALIAFGFAVLLPGDLLTRPRRYIASVDTELATAIEMIAHGLRFGQKEQLRDAHAQLRGVQRILDDADTANRSALDIIALNLALRRHRPEAAELSRQHALLTRAAHTAELLLRQSRGVVDERGPQPVVAELFDQSAVVLHTLAGAVRHWHDPQAARSRAVDLAARCSPDRMGDSDWHVVGLVTLMRSTVIDLLQLTGLSRAQAREFLPDTGDVESTSDTLAEDEASQVWGGGSDGPSQRPSSA